MAAPEAENEALPGAADLESPAAGPQGAPPATQAGAATIQGRNGILRQFSLSLRRAASGLTRTSSDVLSAGNGAEGSPQANHPEHPTRNGTADQDEALAVSDDIESRKSTAAEETWAHEAFEAAKENTKAFYRRRRTPVRLAAVMVAVIIGLLLGLQVNHKSQTDTLTAFRLLNSESRCNDGTEPMFHYAAARAGNERDWIIMLAEGGQCSDLDSCMNRGMEMMSTESVGETRTVGGVFASSSINTLSSFNKVFVYYCSSDGWHGDKDYPFPESSAEKLSFFHGSRIIDDVFTELMDPNSTIRERLPLLKSNHRVVFGGFSAGSRGAMVNADRVRERFNFTTFGVILDSPYYVHLADYWLVNQTIGVYERFVKGSPIAVENNVREWKDLFGEYRLPQVRSPFVLIASQLDSYQVGQVTPDAWRFVTRTREQLEDLQPLNNCSTVFSTIAHIHANTRTSAYFSMTVEESSLFSVVNEFVDTLGKECLEPRPKYIDPRGALCNEETEGIYCESV